MTDWQEQLKKYAKDQGMELPEADENTVNKKTAKALPQQTPKIEYSGNPKYNRMATAPYNFVPLNCQVIFVPPFACFDAYDTRNRKTGYIDCDLETITPLFIRDGGDEKESTTKSSDFFAPTGKLQIPGSSLRGMIRTLVEILTWSRLATDLDRLFYYRGLADKSNLRQEYQDHMAPYNKEKKSSTYLMNAGYFVKKGTRYQIVPAQFINNRQFRRIKKEETEKITPDKRKTENFYFEYQSNWVVISGKMPNKKHDWVIHPPDHQAGKITIPEIDIRNYKLDENRKGMDLLAEINRSNHDMVPCFYVQWQDSRDDDRVSFGYTAMFRLAYQQHVGDLLPDDMRDFSQIDMAEAIFGTVAPAGAIAGRVYFEDAYVHDKNQVPGQDKKIPEILSSPNPTTFQHYLVQRSDYIKALNHYNSPTVLRGHKLYWHRNRDGCARKLVFDSKSFSDFIAKKGITIPEKYGNEHGNKFEIKNFPDLQNQQIRDAIFAYVQSDKKSQYTVIKPVPAGTKFRARIRFENLLDAELGALLSALQLPENCCHKLGMGKPLGLGSIRVTPQLYLSDRQKRYTDILAEWTEPPRPEPAAVVQALKTKFEQFILQHLNAAEKPGTNNLWHTYRLRQLQTMLDWSHTNLPHWNARTRYLEIEHWRNGNEYKNRSVLPVPEDVGS